MFRLLGQRATRAFKSSLDELNRLHSILEPYLLEQFGSSKRGRPNGPIPTKLRLSAAIRFFCGAPVHDIQLTHGISGSSVYKSVYGVINAVNRCPELHFNAGGAEFPSHEEQHEIAHGFYQRSGARFKVAILALDGMLVWTNQPTEADCEDIGIGQRSFHCYRKDKFGMLLMAGADHRCCFRWADICHPGSASDYTAWLTSDVGSKLQDPDQTIVAPGLTIIGDNAFVESNHMSVPIPGKHVTQEEDAYNFYLSQLRITVERAFGILVHRFAILRTPISLSIKKVPALVMSLMRLHNWYIDNVGRATPAGFEDDETFVQYRAWKENSVAVQLNKYRVPEELLGSGHHRKDQARRVGKHRARDVDMHTPMRKMMQQVIDMHLRRPPISNRFVYED